MDLARCLAERGRYSVAPNPLVGAVVARDGSVLSEGWHSRAGEDHAEIVALGRAGGASRGATLYVTLEPCNHYGRTPPCVEAILRAGISRVVVGHLDPDPRMQGSSVRILREAGVEVDVLDDPARLTAGAGISPAPESFAATYTTEGPRQQGMPTHFDALLRYRCL